MTVELPRHRPHRFHLRHHRRHLYILRQHLHASRIGTIPRFPSPSQITNPSQTLFHAHLPLVHQNKSLNLSHPLNLTLSLHPCSHPSLMPRVLIAVLPRLRVAILPKAIFQVAMQPSGLRVSLVA